MRKILKHHFWVGISLELNYGRTLYYRRGVGQNKIEWSIILQTSKMNDPKNTEKFDNYFRLSFYLVKKLSSGCSEDTFASMMNQPQSFTLYFKLTLW